MLVFLKHIYVLLNGKGVGIHCAVYVSPGAGAGAGVLVVVDYVFINHCVVFGEAPG